MKIDMRALFGAAQNFLWIGGFFAGLCGIQAQSAATESNNFDFAIQSIEHGYCVLEDTLPVKEVMEEHLRKTYRQGEGPKLRYQLTYGERSEHYVVVVDLRSGDIHSKRIAGRKVTRSLTFTPENHTRGSREPLVDFLDRINRKIQELRLIACLGD